MLQLKETLYINDPEVSLHLSGKALQARDSNGGTCHIPSHLLEKLVTFSHTPASPQVLEFCAKEGIGVVFLSQSGRLRFRVEGERSTSSALRKKQYLLGREERLCIARVMIRGKLEQQAQVLARFRRNHPERGARLEEAERELSALSRRAGRAESGEKLRGLEGIGSRLYFDVFDDLLLTEEPSLRFSGRSRRPPRDRCNALLSYLYTLLTWDCASALEGMGLTYCRFFPAFSCILYKMC